MKRSIISAIAVAAVSFALSACAAGVDAQTSRVVPAVAGVEATFPGPDGKGSIAVRNAALVYPGTEGYKSGSAATAHVWLFNDTPTGQLVVIKYQGQEVKRVTVKTGSFERSELKFKVNQDVGNQNAVRLSFEFVGLKLFELDLPIAPPTAPPPAVKISIAPEPGDVSH